MMGGSIRILPRRRHPTFFLTKYATALLVIYSATLSQSGRTLIQYPAPGVQINVNLPNYQPTHHLVPVNTQETYGRPAYPRVGVQTVTKTVVQRQVSPAQPHAPGTGLLPQLTVPTTAEGGVPPPQAHAIIQQHFRSPTASSAPATPLTKQKVTTVNRKVTRIKTTRRIPKHCRERVMKKITTRRRTVTSTGEVGEWTVVVQYYEVLPNGVLKPIDQYEAEKCLAINMGIAPESEKLEKKEVQGQVEAAAADEEKESEAEKEPETADEKETEEDKDRAGAKEPEEDREMVGEKETEIENEKPEDESETAGQLPLQKPADETPVAHISKIPTDKPPDATYLDFSDPQNRGKRWCWKLVFPSVKPHNFGFLVHYHECQKNTNSPYYQETTDSTVCTSTGGVEIDYRPFAKTSLPYKIACIPRIDAMKTHQESCWVIHAKTPNLVLVKVPWDTHEAQQYCSAKQQPWPFHDRLHISSRFEVESGGVPGLYHCNRNGVERASVLYHMTPEGHIAGFAETFCDPPAPLPEYACSGVVFNCFYYHAPPVV